MSFENVYFITGTAYAGKSTMVHLLAEKHGGQIRAGCGSYSLKTESGRTI